MLLTSFVTRGLIALPAALALMLGADLGTTLAVQALSFNLAARCRSSSSPASSLARIASGGRDGAGRAHADRLRPDPAGARR